MSKRCSINILIFVFAFVFFIPSEGSCLSWLTGKDKTIVDEQGNVVVLRGVNLGGWLVEEMWMLPFVEKDSHGDETIADHVTLWRMIEKRFGQEKMVEMKSAFRRVWIDESDFTRIKEAGLNCVRLPFLASFIEEEGAMEFLDSIIAACERRGLYVILDMHGTFGCQSNADHTGEAGRNQMFSDPEMVQKTADSWKKIADRYKDCQAVAAYDLMNEPMGAPSHKKLYEVYDVFYRSVREVDSRHLVIIEDGYKGIQYTPEPEKTGWENILLSSHTYLGGEKEEKACLERFEIHMEKASKAQEKCNFPYYLGEFNVTPSSHAGTIIAEIIKRLQVNNRSWSMWTYKVAGKQATGKRWGLYCEPKHLRKINVFDDSEEEIFEKITALRTENFVKNEEVFEAFLSTQMH